MSERQNLPASVVVGRIRKPHGVRGEVTIEVLTDVAGRLAVGESVSARLADGGDRSLEIAASRPHGEVRIVRFTGLDSRDDAEALRGATLEIDRTAVPRAPEGSFYYYELAGCSVRDRVAGDLGRVVDVIEDGGGWLLEVQGSAGRLLVPFVSAYLESVDVKARRIAVDLPEGLIELCTST